MHMTKQSLYSTNIIPGPKQMSGKAVPKGMNRRMLFHPGFLNSTLELLLHRILIQVAAAGYLAARINRKAFMKIKMTKKIKRNIIIVIMLIIGNSL